jgi:pyruvate kinase
MVSQPPMVADELRRQADVFVDLAELKLKVGRVASDRPGPRELRQQSPQLTLRGTINGNDLTD